jgi:twinkle protein
LADFLYHEPCPACGSSDAGSRYDDNSFHCFSCEHNIKGDGTEVEEPPTTKAKPWTPIEGAFHALPYRGLKEETCALFGYKVGKKWDGTPVQFIDVRRNGKLIAQKFKFMEDGKKQFGWIGDAKHPPFLGQWLWNKGKHLVITEGEPDMMSMAQAQDLKWPVVSLPNGSKSTEQAITDNYEWLMGFENIVLMFDMDEPGQAAVEVACAMLPIGRVKVASLQLKDANEVLVASGPGPLIKAFWDAKVWRPDGIVDGTTVFNRERLKQGCPPGYPFTYPKLQEMTYGLRKAEITMLTAGSGIGKSTLARELAYELHQSHGLKIGNVYLEENNDITARGYVALHAGVPLGKLQFKTDLITDAQWDSAIDALKDRMLFYDHFGSLESINLQSKLRYLAAVEKVDFIILDHISIVTSGQESSKEGERKDIDMLMTFLAALCQETGVGIIAIVHLKRTATKNFNEGGSPSLSDLRGSGALEQLSHNVYSLERNQQSDKGTEKFQSLIRVLKTRFGFETGEADLLEYNRDSGRNQLCTNFTKEEAPSSFGSEPQRF